MSKLSLSSVKRISKNSIFLLLSRAIDFLAQIAIIPIIARYLGGAQYGDYGYVMAFAFITTSFTYIGLERIIMREISKNPDDAGKFLGAGIIARWIYMAIAIFLTGIIALFMGLSSKIILCVLIAFLALNFTADTFIYLAMFKAFDKMKYETLLTLISQCFNFSFVLFISYFRLGFIAFFIGLSVVSLLRYGLTMVIARRKFVMPDYKKGMPLIKPLLKESYVLGVVSLIVQAFMNVDLLVLKNFKDAFEVSMFYAPHNLLVLMNVIPISIMSGFFPSLSRSAAADLRLLLYKYEKAFKIFAISSVFLSTICIVFARKIIFFLYGKEFIKAIPSFQILVISLIFTMLFVVFDFTLVAVRKQNTLILCSIIGILTKVILDLLLIPKYGYIGASIAAVNGYVAFFICGFVLTSKYVGVLSLYRFVAKPVFVSGLIGLCFYRFNQGNIFFLGALELVLYVLCLWAIRFFSSDEIDLFKGILTQGIGAITGRMFRA